MKENNEPIKDMQHLAEMGWKQMHETLVEHNLSTTAVELPSSFKKRNLWMLAAACFFFLFIFSFPFYLNKPFYTPLESKLSPSLHSSIIPANQTANLREVLSTQGDRPQHNEAELAVLQEKIKSDFLKSTEKSSFEKLQNQRLLLCQKFFSENHNPTSIGPTDQLLDTTIQIHKTILQNKPSKNHKRHIEIFAGAGLNFPFGDKNNVFFKDVNVHPGVIFIIPLNQKLSIHTGLWLLSTIHGKEATASETQLMNNVASNLYYNVHTTSIVKASYFDLPVTINYSIDKNWSIGSGLQLSRLYRLSIKDQKENFDYNNTLYSATVAQYSSSPARAVAVFQKKATIKKYETRFVAEGLFRKKNFLFSAGYYYGLGKTIMVKNTNGTVQQYRNEYFKLGIQYKINKK